MILYLTNYVSEKEFLKRRLNFRNIAASNRVERLSAALSRIDRVIVLSPAYSLGTRFNADVYKESRVEYLGKDISIVYSAVLLIPIIGYIFSFIFFFLKFLRINYTESVSTLVVYNFNLRYLLIILYVKLFKRSTKIVLNIEDIYVFKFEDLFKKEERVVYNLSYQVLSKLYILLSNDIFYPTKRFESVLGNLNGTLVEGCFERSTNLKIVNGDFLSILFAGKISTEHGIVEFTDFLNLLNEKHPEVKVNICGTGSDISLLKAQLKILNNPNYHFHGFVSDEDYRNYLSHANICISLQRPNSRQSSFKTPSKVYEYMHSGKVVISSDVGDLANHSRIIHLVNGYNIPTSIINIIETYINNEGILEKRAAATLKYAEEKFSVEAVSKILAKLL